MVEIQRCIREALAELEHDQWIAWSKNIAETDNISIERAERWAKLWIPYSELTEEQKDQDRIWADKSISVLHSQDVVIKVKRSHDSDCSVHNMPAYPNGPCDCVELPAGCAAVEPLIEEDK